MGLAAGLLSVLSALAAAQDLPKWSQYKRVHQKALDLWEAGDLDAAQRALEKAATEHPEDGETRLWLGIVAAAEGREEAAIARVREALQRDVPPERCVLGTEVGLEALHALDGWAELRDELPELLMHGPTLGAVTGTGVRVWLRTEAAVPVRASVQPVEGGEEISSASVTTAREDDFCAVLRLEGLRPRTEYTCSLEVGGQRVQGGSFTTMAPRGASQELRLVFGGGSGYVPPHERAWRTVLEQEPDLLLLLGDNVYIDHPESRAMQHYCYYRRQSRPEFRALVRSVPCLAIWDDHDFGTNDCSGGPALDRPAWKPEVWEVFQRNWPNPDYAWGEGPGCWFEHWVGDVHFVFLDGRCYRTPKKQAEDGAPTMLGPRQRAWLSEVLRREGATFTVLVSPVPWTFRAKGDSKDTWNGFRSERDELFAELADLGKEGVILMSADRHRSDLWKIERDGAYDLYEFNSSRLTNQHVHPVMKDAEFSYNAKQSFGVVDFDTTAEDPTARYRVVNIDGKVVEEFTLRRSWLR